MDAPGTSRRLPGDQGLDQLTAVAAVAASAFLVVLLVPVLFDLLGNKHPLIVAAAETGIITALTLPLLALGGLRGPYVVFFAAAVLGALMRIWISPLIVSDTKHYKGYAEKVGAFHASDLESPQSMKVFAFSVRLAFLIAWWLEVSYLAGWNEAGTATNFLASSHDPTTLVVRFYGDIGIGVSVDAKERSVGDEIKLLPLSDGITLTRRYMGTLKAAGESEATR